MSPTRFPKLLSLLTGANDRLDSLKARAAAGTGGARKAQKDVRRATLEGLAAAVGRDLPSVLR